MFCNQTISVYVLMRQRVLALNIQSILCTESDIEVLVLPETCSKDLQTVLQFRPDVVITDVATCSLQSVVDMEQIKQQGTTRFLFLYSSASEANDILALGADGVVAKSAPAESLALAVRNLANGRVWLDENIWSKQSTIVAALPENAETDSGEPVVPSTRLSYREIEILRLAAEGFSNKEIAKRMNLSHDTVKCCMWLIVRKLKARGRVHAVTVARQCGIFS